MKCLLGFMHFVLYIVSYALYYNHFIPCIDDHIESIDKYTEEVFEALGITAKQALPNIGGQKKSENSGPKNVIPGWDMMVKPFKDDAMFWKSIWVSLGRPINSQIHNVMKHTRNVYHYEIRKCIKAEEKVKKNKLLDACFNGGGDIFEEIKKLRKAPE